MAEVIRGKIAALVDESTVIVNVGARHGVKEGTILVVYEEADEVKDPDTGEVLGRWELVKGHLIAVHVQDSLTTCEGVDVSRRGSESLESQPTTLSAQMIRASMPRLSGRGTATLEIRKDQMLGRARPGPIAVGDRVRSLLGQD